MTSVQLTDPFTDEERSEITEAFAAATEQFDRINAALRDGNVVLAAIYTGELLQSQRVTVTALEHIQTGLRAEAARRRQHG